MSGLSPYYIFVFLFFICSAFFSAAEASYLSIDRILIGRLKKNRSLGNRLILFFLGNFEVFVVTLLIMNLLANISATLFATRIFEVGLEALYWVFFFEVVPWSFFQVVGDMLFIFFFTGLILVFCEFIPKRLAVKHYAGFLSLSIFPVSLSYGLFFLPAFIVVFGVRGVNGFFSRHLLKKAVCEIGGAGDSEEPSSLFKFDKRQFLSYVKLGSKTGVFQKRESHLLEGILAYMSTPVKSFLIPREKIEGIDLSHWGEERDIKDVRRLVKAIKRFPYGQVPVYEKSLDHLRGIISKKKLVLLRLDVGLLSQKEFLDKYLDNPDFIPESKNVLEVLGHIYHSVLEVAIISDEYGGLEGMVSYKDIIQKLFQFSQPVGQLGNKNLGLRALRDGGYYARADLFLNDFNNHLNVRVVCEEAETIGGYLLEKFRRVPKRGERFRDSFFEYRIRSATNRRIVSLEVFPLK